MNTDERIRINFKKLAFYMERQKWTLPCIDRLLCEIADLAEQSHYGIIDVWMLAHDVMDTDTKEYYRSLALECYLER